MPQLTDMKELGNIFWVDFSENLKPRAKFEPQEAHFEGKEYSLFCAVVDKATSEKAYDYHYYISDDRTHDAAFADIAMNDLINHYPDIEYSPVIRFRMDNCKNQFKCLKTFSRYKEISKKLGKPLIIYYGIPGHGKGLVDACSSFGVKQPLRRACIIDDKMFNSATEILEDLKHEFSHIDNRFYREVTSEELSENRDNYSQERDLVIEGCMSMRAICFFPDGSLQTKEELCACHCCKLGIFSSCIYPTKLKDFTTNITKQDMTISLEHVVKTAR